MWSGDFARKIEELGHSTLFVADHYLGLGPTGVNTLLPRPRTSRLVVLLLSVAIATGLATTVVSAAALPACRVADVTTTNRSYTDWARTILDTTYRLTSAYGPSDLRSTADAGLNGGQRVRALVITDLRAIARAANSSGCWDAGAAMPIRESRYRPAGSGSLNK